MALYVEFLGYGTYNRGWRGFEAKGFGVYGSQDVYILNLGRKDDRL